MTPKPCSLTSAMYPDICDHILIQTHTHTHTMLSGSFLKTLTELKIIGQQKFSMHVHLPSPEIYILLDYLKMLQMVLIHISLCLMLKSLQHFNKSKE